jgi:hypothetical protein
MFALLVLAPASADKPVCDGTEPVHPSCKKDDPTPPPEPPVEVCVFMDGVLQNWDPPASYRCQWTIPVNDMNKTFNFTLDLVTPVDGATVNLPHLIVTDTYPYGGQICFNEYEVGWNPLPYSWSSFTPPSEGVCTGGGGVAEDQPNVFAITIDVIKVKKGAVKLTYTME